MKLFIAMFALQTIGAAAQELTPPIYVYSSPVMGKTVKGVPYAADEITESTQVLSDGTQIRRQSQTTVYRDGEGRVRREGPDKIIIFDPVAGFSYTLNPAGKTAVISTMGTLVDKQKRFIFRTGTAQNTDPAGQTKADVDKLKAEMAAQLEQASAKLATRGDPPPHENLGPRVIDGVTANGTLTIETILAGAIGNDRPFRVVTETWVSPDLQTIVMSKHSDPRTGEETFRLANVRRGEPGADLFLVPVGYQMVNTAGAAKN